MAKNNVLNPSNVIGNILAYWKEGGTVSAKVVVVVVIDALNLGSNVMQIVELKVETLKM